MAKRKVLYVIPYIYDEPDDSWPIKYLNDEVFALGGGGGVSIHGTGIREREDGTPIDGQIEILGEEAVHDFLKAQPDVTFVRDLD